MTDGLIFVVEVQRIALVNALEYLGERDILCLYEQMNVVVHEDVRIERIPVPVLVDG
jgi:hypothetical protein